MDAQKEDTSHQMDVDDGEANQIRILQKVPLPENGDCLERIFMYSGTDIDSLLNVGSSSKLFQEVAASVFQRKYGSKTIVLCCFDNCRHKNHSNNSNRICLRGMKKILPFVRVFGSAFSKLEVHYFSRLNYANLERSAVDLKMWRLNEYINRYCANTLSSLEWYYKPKLPNDFKKPFQQLEQLCLRWSYLNDLLPNFVKTFPNLQRFDMLADSLDQRFTAVTLPQLKHLAVTFIDMDDHAANLAQLKHVSEFLKANPQLQGVNVNKSQSTTEYVTIKDFFDMVSGNAQLTKIEISVIRRASNPGTNIDAVDVNQFVREHPNLVELAIYDEHEFKADAALAVMCELSSLKKFRFNIKADFERNKFIQHLGNDWIYTASNPSHYYHRMNLYRKN